MKNLLKTTILILFLQANLGYSQTVCNEGFAGVYACNDYDLMAQISLETLTGVTNAEGSDIWGWTDTTTGKEYALIATSHTTAFVDISNPITPIILGRLDTETSANAWRDVKVYNNYAFIVADNVGAHGMQVFDLTRLRSVASPPEVFTADTVYTGVGSCHNIVINESEGVAYLVGCNIASGGPVFIDISNPLSPTSLGSYSAEGYSHDAQVITYNGPDTDYSGQEILIASNGSFGASDKFVILDVSDKNNVIKIAEASYTQPGYAHQGWFTDDHRYFILGDETDETSYGMDTRTLVFDLLDMDNPVLTSTYSGPSGAIDHNGYVKGNNFFLANYRAGMRVVDIPSMIASSNTNAATAEIGYFDTYPANDGANYNGAWSIYPYFASGNIIISDIDSGLFIVRQSNTLSIEETALSSNFTISPNPAFENPRIKSNNNQLINSIELFNVLGQKIFSKNNIDKKEYVLNTNTYTNGIYLVKINATITKKIVLK